MAKSTKKWSRQVAEAAFHICHDGSGDVVEIANDEVTADLIARDKNAQTVKLALTCKYYVKKNQAMPACAAAESFVA